MIMAAPGIGETLAEAPWWAFFLVVMITIAQLLMLTLVILLAAKINRLVAKVDEVSQNAGKFLQMGMSYFRKKD
jgi:hypothetical protein